MLVYRSVTIAGGLPCILISWLFLVPKDGTKLPFVSKGPSSFSPRNPWTFRHHHNQRCESPSAGWLSPWESCTMGTHVNPSFLGVIRQTHIWRAYKPFIFPWALGSKSSGSMLGKKSKNILPNGGCWWFIVVESKQSPKRTNKSYHSCM